MTAAISLHTVKPIYSRKRGKRIGRGGKRGSYSGRGIKGQRSRAGRRIRPAERDLILRIPKKRGFRNKPIRPKPAVLDIHDLILRVKAHGKGLATPMTIDLTLLKTLRLVPRRYNGEVKVLGKGSVDLALHLKGIKVSKRVTMAIQQAGGQVQ